MKIGSGFQGTIEAIKSFSENGFLVIVVSNQAGIARGLYSEADVISLHQKVNNELCRHGTKIDAFYYCPHHPEFGDKIACYCRKPAPGLLIKAQTDWGIDLSRSFMIGDKADDVKAGAAANVTPILVSTGYGARQRHMNSTESTYTKDLLTASHFIAKNFEKRN